MGFSILRRDRWPKYFKFTVRAIWDENTFKSNRAEVYTMNREKVSNEEMEKFGREWWEDYILHVKKTGHNAGTRLIDRGLKLIKLEYQTLGWASWCPGWFRHWTFDEGQSDADIKRGFLEYVERTYDINDPHIGRGSLMGADELWRWKICRCDACKTLGIITVDH